MLFFIPLCDGLAIAVCHCNAHFGRITVLS